MKKLIQDLFEQNGFFFTQQNEFTLFFREPSTLKKEFWVVCDLPLSEVLSIQSQLYKRCKELNGQEELDKNISMIIPVLVESEVQVKELKSELLKTEEDGYFFKKYVLIFSASEQDALIEQQKDKSINEFLKKSIASQSCFEVYKSNPHQLQWQSLVYRMASKIPFINLDFKVNKDMTSLFEMKEAKIKTKGLADFEAAFENAFDHLSYLDLSHFKAVDLMGKLNEKLKDQHGTSNQ
jgi:hypothetical protein